MPLPLIFPRAVTILILIVGATTRSEAGIAIPKRTVRMTNDLGGGLDLTVHCKQKDEDLGVHLLHPNETYEFTFRPNFWGTTLYFCGFSWPGVLHWFNIFTMKRDFKKCFTCIWQIRQDKPCRLGKKSHVFDDCYNWSSSSFIPHFS
ncbi:S-protein homolog 2-like [Neltuma alba]|uniref:S-protein homolog 2-like n=1 Tax=Neltuma alba TaxID=207710 RepID=UPI0010A47294|nr:S-protein homolog 2-like [Prosopis alba]